MIPLVLVIPVGFPLEPEPSRAALSIATAIDFERSSLIRFSTSNEDWIISCLVTSVNAPRVLGDIVTEPITISDSPDAPPSDDMKAALEAAVFLGIFTSPERPFRLVANGITDDAFLSASIKSAGLKSWPTKPASSDAFKSLVDQLDNTSGGSIIPWAVLP